MERWSKEKGVKCLRKIGPRPGQTVLVLAAESAIMPSRRRLPWEADELRQMKSETIVKI